MKGKKYKTATRIFHNIAFWIRQKLIDKATTKIEKLENTKDTLVEKELLPIQDRVEKIEIELNNRGILSNSL